MSIKKYYNGAWQDVNFLRKYQNGAWQNCSFARKFYNGAWEKVYPTDLYLYNYGDECVGTTGGWLGPQTLSTRYSNIGTGTKASDHIEYVGTSMSTAGFVTANPIDLTPYSTWYIDFRGAHTWYDDQNGTATRAYFNISTTRLSVDSCVYSHYIDQFVRDTPRGIYTHDISGINGPCYFSLCSDYIRIKLYMYRMWLS